MVVLNTSSYLQIGNVEIKLDDVDAGGVLISGKYSKITRLLIVGEGGATYTKTGLRIDNTAGSSSIMEFLIKGLKGTGAIGLAINQGGSTENLTLMGTIEDCTTCINPGSQSAGGSTYDITTILTSGQTSLAFAFSPKPTDTIFITERNSSGTWTTLNSKTPT